MAESKALAEEGESAKLAALVAEYEPQGLAAALDAAAASLLASSPMPAEGGPWRPVVSVEGGLAHLRWVLA